MEKIRAKLKKNLTQDQYDKLKLQGLVDPACIYFIENTKRIYVGAALFIESQGGSGIPREYSTELPDGTLLKREYNEDGDDFRISFFRKDLNEIDFHVEHTFEFAVDYNEEYPDGIGVFKIDQVPVFFSDQHPVLVDDIDQSIDGNKTFVKQLTIPNPIEDYHAATKEYVDTNHQDQQDDLEAQIDALRGFLLNDTDEEIEIINNRIDNEVETLNSRIDSEVTTINSRIDNEVETLNNTIEVEVARATAAEQKLDEKIDSETARAVAAEQVEKEERIAADEAEQARAEAAEAAEQARAEAAEEELENKKINKTAANETSGFIVGDITLNRDDQSIKFYKKTLDVFEGGLNPEYRKQIVSSDNSLDFSGSDDTISMEVVRETLYDKLVSLVTDQTISGKKTFTQEITGDIDGHADHLKYSRDLDVNLEDDGSAAEFNGTKNVTLPIRGVLPTVHGGSGKDYQFSYIPFIILTGTESETAVDAKFTPGDLIVRVNNDLITNLVIGAPKNLIDDCGLKSVSYQNEIVHYEKAPTTVVGLKGNESIFPVTASFVVNNKNYIEQFEVVAAVYCGARQSWVDGDTQFAYRIKDQFGDKEFFDVVGVIDAVSKTGNLGTVANAVTSQLYRRASGSVIKSGGSGYKVGDKFTFLTPDNKSWANLQAARGFVSEVSNGVATRVIMRDSGWYENNIGITEFSTSTNGNGTGLIISASMVQTQGTTLADVLNPYPGNSVTVLRDETFNGLSQEWIYRDENHDGNYEWIQLVPYSRERPLRGDTTYTTVDHSLTDEGGTISLSKRTKHVIDTAVLPDEDQEITGIWHIHGPTDADDISNKEYVDEQVNIERLAREADVDEEQARAEAAEEAETSRATAAEEAETSRATAAEEAETARATAAEEAETNRATTEEAAIRDEFAAADTIEKARAEAAEAAEQSRAEAEEEAETLRATTEEAAIRAEVASSEKALDDRLTLHDSNSVKLTYTPDSSHADVACDPINIDGNPVPTIEVTSRGLRIPRYSIIENQLSRSLFDWINSKLEVSNALEALYDVYDGHLYGAVFDTDRFDEIQSAHLVVKNEFINSHIPVTKGLYTIDGSGTLLELQGPDQLVDRNVDEDKIDQRQILRSDQVQNVTALKLFSDDDGNHNAVYVTPKDTDTKFANGSTHVATEAQVARVISDAFNASPNGATVVQNLEYISGITGLTEYVDTDISTYDMENRQTSGYLLGIESDDIHVSLVDDNRIKLDATRFVRKDQSTEYIKSLDTVVTGNDINITKVTHDGRDGSQISGVFTITTKPSEIVLAQSGQQIDIELFSGLASQYWRGDMTWQILDKHAVGLGNVDNTSDMDKPVSTAQAAAIKVVQDYATAVSGNLNSEISRAITRENVISGELNTETINRINADATEKARAENAESGLRADLNTEASTRASADATITTNLNTHVNNTTIHITAAERSGWNAKQAALNRTVSLTGNVTGSTTDTGGNLSISTTIAGGLKTVNSQSLIGSGNILISSTDQFGKFIQTSNPGAAPAGYVAIWYEA
jgi:hypothetical protein